MSSVLFNMQGVSGKIQEMECERCIFVPTNTDIAIKTEIKSIWKTDMETSSFPELSLSYSAVKCQYENLNRLSLLW